MIRFWVNLFILLFFTAPSLVAASEQSETVITNGRIAFVSEKDGDAEIYTINPDGSDPQQLTLNEEFDDFVRWSPDGSQLVYYHDFELFVMNADGSNPVRLESTFAARAPDWSPDGEQLVFIQSKNVTVLYLNDGVVVRLTDRTELAEVYDENPIWSPDGSQIAFSSSGDNGVPFALDGNPTMELHIMNADGTNLTSLGWLGGYFGGLNWASDNHIIYQALSPTAPEFIGIYSYDLSDGSVTSLSDLTIDSYNPALSPDETKIAFVQRGDRLAIMNRDGSEPTVILDGQKNIIDVDWQPVIVAGD